MLRTLFADETGFIISAELVLVATIVVIGLIVGLSEVQHATVQELNDVADAVGSLNQGFFFTGMRSHKRCHGGIGAITFGSTFFDSFDDCDNNQCALTCAGAIVEGPKFGGGFGGGGFGGGFGGFGGW